MMVSYKTINVEHKNITEEEKERQANLGYPTETTEKTLSFDRIFFNINLVTICCEVIIEHKGDSLSCTEVTLRGGAYFTLNTPFSVFKKEYSIFTDKEIKNGSSRV